MLVYGDHHDQAEPQLWARDVNRQLDLVSGMSPGLHRHSRLVTALVETGRLLQGIADSVFANERRDRRSAATGELGETLLQLAQAVCRSWDSRFVEVGELPRLRISRHWPSEVELRVPEGFAFYAAYPEAFAEAARRLELAAPARVIGIRSIGTSLGAVVAAALGAPAAVTVRPFGDPSDRKIALHPELERELLDGDHHYVIVDEGPGQSGSSFAAIGDWLQSRGVPIERIALVTSHSGTPGSAATEARLQWWRRVQRQAADFGERWPELIRLWSGDLLRPLEAPPRDLSGGRWRPLRYSREADWPATVRTWERRKYLVRARGEPFLVKFAGLGRAAEEKLAIARGLHSEGFTPEPIGLVHGFLVERWCENAAPLEDHDKPVREIARYIGTRARLLPAGSDSGASVDELVQMIRRNISLAFGQAAARMLEPMLNRAGELEGRILRVRTDNKLDRHEWLRTESGSLLKVDALDHHRAHDLVGCQDLAWDVAGAMVEFDLHQGERDAFVDAVENWSGKTIDPELLEFCRLAYLAFRLGQARLGASMTDASEWRRIDRRGRRYALELQHLLESTRCATRRESLLGYRPE